MDIDNFKNYCDLWDKVLEKEVLTSNVTKHEEEDVADYLFQERQLSKQDLANAANKMASSPNPVYPNSLGKDQDLIVTPNWSDGKDLIELHNMKISLHALENKLNTAWANQNSKNVGKIQEQIRNLKRQIDDLSDSLPPNIFDDSESAKSSEE